MTNYTVTSSTVQNEAWACLYIFHMSGYWMGKMTNRFLFCLRSGSSSVLLGSMCLCPFCKKKKKITAFSRWWHPCKVYKWMIQCLKLQEVKKDESQKSEGLNHYNSLNRLSRFDSSMMVDKFHRFTAAIATNYHPNNQCLKRNLCLFWQGEDKMPFKWLKIWTISLRMTTEQLDILYGDRGNTVSHTELWVMWIHAFLILQHYTYSIIWYTKHIKNL